MNKLLFKNTFFKSERLCDGSTVVTVLNDNDKFLGIDISLSKLITNKEGFIADIFTTDASEAIKKYSNETGISEYDIKIELRNRTLNRLMGML